MALANSTNPDFQANDVEADRRTTIGEVLQWYEANPSRPIHSGPAEIERRRLWDLFKGQFGQRLISSCRPFELLNFINSQQGVRSDWTRKRWASSIQRPFNYAEALGMIFKNPFRGLTFSQGDDGRDWTDGEFQRVLRAANPSFRRLIVGLRFSGLRPGELCDLEWKDIRLEQGAIVIEKHKTRYRTKRPRIVPLNPVLVKLLGWLRRNPGHCQICGAARAAGVKFDSRFVFLNSKNCRWHRSMADTGFRRLRVKVGLPADLKLHGCRHTFATRAIINGVGVVELGQLLGHVQVATTQRYVHLAAKTDHLNESMRRAVRPGRKASIDRTGLRQTPPEGRR